MKNWIRSMVVALGVACCAVLTAGVSTGSALTTGDLVSLLVSQLGVTEQQAEGGAGAVFKNAQDNLEAKDYAVLTGSMPEITTLVDKAPTVKKKSSGWMSSASSLLGDSGKSVENASSLLNSFDSLGMDSAMLAKFTPIVMDYVQENGGDICVKLLQSVL